MTNDGERRKIRKATKKAEDALIAHKQKGGGAQQRLILETRIEVWNEVKAILEVT